MEDTNVGRRVTDLVRILLGAVPEDAEPCDVASAALYLSVLVFAEHFGRDEGWRYAMNIALKRAMETF